MKPAIKGLDDHHINELLCLRAAHLLGLPAAGVDVIESGDVQALVSTRYDRTTSRDGRYRRLHQEDLCQALSIHPLLKYQTDGGPGIGQIADLFLRLPLNDRDASRRRFLDGVAYSVAMAGTDAHAKNYSILLAGDRAQLAPLYDVSSAAPYNFETPAAAAMKVGDHWTMREINELDWAKAARRLGLDDGQAVERVTSIRARVPKAFHEAAVALPTSLQGRGFAIADAVTRHVESLPPTWGR